MGANHSTTTVAPMTAAQVTAVTSAPSSSAHTIEMKGSLSPTTVIAVKTLPMSVLNGATAPTVNPCAANVTDTLLTKAIVQAQNPGMKWGNSEPWTAQEMQCWAWLATKSEEVHPGRQFVDQYKFEPFLLQL